MKKTFLFAMSLLLLTTIYSQNIVKEHYTVSGGVLGAVNVSKFRVSGQNPTNIEYESKPGWSAGAWVNFPLGKSFSIEPQVMYSSYRYYSNNTTPLLLNNGEINYISLPLALKFHAGDKFAIILGPQVDFITSLEDKNNVMQEEGIKKESFSAFGGFELFPHGRVTLFGRYIHGFSNMDDMGRTESSGLEFKNQNFQTGLKLKLFGKKIPADSDGDGVSDPKDKCPNVAGLARYDGCPIPDKDGDGINDEEDKCPDQPGTLKYNGCPIPDTDGDGINDEQDKCPDKAGIAKYNGCPIPDTDGDGINDEEDRCPTQAGPASRNGCPVTDKDNDGVNDEVDKCPDVPGTAANNGCPEIPANVSKTLGSAAMNIAFGTGTNNTKLATKSNASLNQVVAIMRDNPTLKVRIEGHTDNAGNDDANMVLSENRAEAVKAYLVSKGISEDRITTQGFGETMPIANNSTPTGRTKNRRIEIKIDY
jgi:outer membrane protein OmpA-like peptidoglycan-associated protein